MGPTSRMISLWPEFVALGLFFGLALWSSPDMKPVGSVLLKERRYVRLTLVTLMSTVLFGSFMAVVTWLLLKIGLLDG